MQKKHFFLGNKIVDSRSFTPPTQPYPKPVMPLKNRAAQASRVKDCYEASVSKLISQINTREQQGLPVADGVYINLDMGKKFIPQRLGDKSGATIMKVSDREDDTENLDVTLYIQKEKKDWLSKKTDEYAREDTKNGNPRNAQLIEPINEVTPADIHSLYVSAEKFDQIPDGRTLAFEVWLCHGKSYDKKNVRQVLDKLGIDVVTDPLQFESVDVWLIEATKQQLSYLPLSLGYIENIRPYYQPSVLVKDCTSSQEWCELLKGMVVNIDEGHCTQVGILDTGVNNKHELLSSALPDERMRSVIGVKGPVDENGHGTGMAGLVLLGDLTNLAYEASTTVNIGHALISVKILEDGYDSDFYAATIEQAVNVASEIGAAIQCMAVTDEDAYDGSATSSSAALDDSIYHDGLCDRLVIVSAGNIPIRDIDFSQYVESCKANPVQSPAQAWNALTIGSYTEKTICTDKKFAPLAAPGGVSPFSRTSYSWFRGLNKPEIVMEGGNVAYHPIYKETLCNDLSLITTSYNLKNPLETFEGTSAATALAARLAAQIKIANPNLSMLSIRGLMVHSAQWTKEMMRIEKLDERMALCGYGVPNEDVAMYSNEKYATYIFENNLTPYEAGKGANKYKELHYYDLPWPIDLLERMGDENVKIKITLSYYIKPSPGNGGWTNKYRYPSATLHFDLKTATETTEEFLCRRNQKEGESTTKNDSDRWNIKQTKRERGSVQSDWIECSAAELAELGQIVVWPGSGWWKERKLANVANSIPYSLIVSIETERTEIYNAVETAISSRIGIQIAQET